MKNSVIAIQSYFVITTIVYALLCPVFFVMDIAQGEENFVDDSIDKTTYGQQQVVVSENKCKSPCLSSAEMCIEMCA